jgi:hypothetical protein
VPTEIIVAFLTGGAFVAIINLFKWWIERKDSKQKRKITDVLGRIHDVYHILNVLLRETSADRAVILRAENGGDVPMVGKELYSSVVYEVFDGLGSVKDRWQRQPLDEEYVRMLLQVAEKGHASVRTAKLKACPLKDLFEADSVGGAEVYKIKAKEGAFFYLAVHFKQEGPVNSSFRDILRYSINELERLIV